MYSEEQKALIWLNSFNISASKKMALVAQFTATGLYNNFVSSRADILKIIDQDAYATMKYALDDNYVKTLLGDLEKNNITVISEQSNMYPEQLKQIDCPPLLIYCKGSVKLLQTKCIAMVGARKNTYYGKKVTEYFARGLVDNGYTVVSGLATGIDAIAHSETLKRGGNTIAVLGSGICSIYPEQNTNLANEIIEKGLLISEFPPYTKAQKFHFPMRNRIVSGLSKGVIICEAAKTSGALLTAKNCLDQGRELFVVGGDIFRLESQGVNNLIKNAQGAMITDIDDILSRFEDGISVNKPARVKQKLQLNMIEQVIYDIIKSGGEMHFDDIADLSQIDIQELTYELTNMELKGLIIKLPSNYYSLA